MVSRDRRGRAAPWLLGAIALAVGLALLLWQFGRLPGSGPESPAAAPSDAPAAAGAEARPEPIDALRAPLRVDTHGVIELERAQLPKGAPLALTLGFDKPLPNATPFPVRILALADAADQRREIHLEATPYRDAPGARLEIDPEFLTPGRYLVEVRTSEMVAIPLRRYQIVVR